MKIRNISVTVTETLNCGNYETLRPEISLSADLDPDDDLTVCNDQLFAQASEMWARNALVELARLAKRRADPDKRHEFQESTKGLKDQLKSMLDK